MTKNELNEKQLNNVSGGTVEELGDLMNALYPGEEIGRPLCRAASHVPITSRFLTDSQVNNQPRNSIIF